jgi:hypothetical protein
MTTDNDTKLRKLFKVLQQGNVVTIPLLESLGISDNLRKYYLESGWLESLGRGAYKKPGDTIGWQGALSALQKQVGIKVHVGGLSALELHGYSHYFRLSRENLYLFSPQRSALPKWFTNFDWGVELLHKPTSFLPNEIGVKDMDINRISISISSPERAIMECLHLAPQNTDLVECFQVFEGLVNLKPKLVTELLSNCTSIKVKRLFLYMAEKANHQWFQFIKTNKINLGNGKRMITEKGVYNAKYLISIPKELIEL